MMSAYSDNTINAISACSVDISLKINSEIFLPGNSKEILNILSSEKSTYVINSFCHGTISNGCNGKCSTLGLRK